MNTNSKDKQVLFDDEILIAGRITISGHLILSTLFHFVIVPFFFIIYFQ